MPRLRSRPDERNPDTIFLFSLLIFAAVAQVANGAAPDSVEALLPTWAAVLWGVSLALSGALVLWGTIRRDAERGEGVELVGRSIFGPIAASYGVALIFHQTSATGSLLAAAPFFGISATCFWRIVQIVHRRQRTLRTARGR